LTNDALEVIAEGPDLAIAVPEAALAAMDAWNQTHHTASGLLARVRKEGVPLAEAEDEVLRFVARFVPRGKGILCGNSVHVDRRFLAAQMPRLEAWLHYRIIDVSTVKELARRWYGLRPPPKRAAHRARDDILESIEELRFYRRAIFRG
ncbi:MAG: oligoribonuclease, partial [Zetaproteobacteria bacterium]